jgi:hypothetical protein
MRQNVIFLASIAAFFATLFLMALAIALIAKGNAGYGLVILFLGVPVMAGITVTFDFVRNKMALSDDPDLDVDIIKPKFTKFGSGR